MSIDRKKTFTPLEIEERLKADLPHWRYEDGWIRRTYRTNSWKGTLMLINAVGHLAEAAWHHPDITASYAWVEVRLMSHDAKGITVRDAVIDLGYVERGDLTLEQLDRLREQGDSRSTIPASR